MDGRLWIAHPFTKEHKMNKFIWLVVLLVFLAIVLGPIIIHQFQKHESRTLQGVHLAELRYTEVSFRNEDQNLNLAGMLFVPDDRGPFPAVVIIHGADTSTRDNSWYLTLTNYLQSNGVAVLLPDKRGSVKSEGDWHTSSMEDLATDTLAAVDFLKNLGMVKISKVGVIGMSQGGWIAPIAAVRSADIEFIVNVVGTSLTSYDVLHYEETNNLREMGFFPVVSDLIAYPSTWVLRNITQKEFWGKIGNFDALPYWKELEIPILAMYGSDDTNVPAKASKERLDSLNKDNITVIIYEGSEHALQDPPGKGDSIFRDEALIDIKEFINSVK